jgi:hypothetical protein
MKTPKRVAKKPTPLLKKPESDGHSSNGLPPVEPIALGGAVIEELMAIGRAQASVTVVTGRIRGRADQVLVPLVKMNFMGVLQSEIPTSQEAELESVFHETLTLENAFWLNFNLMRDLARECETISKIASGALSLDPARLEHAKIFAEQTARQAAICAIRLEKLAASLSEEHQPGSATPSDEARGRDAQAKVLPKPKAAQKRASQGAEAKKPGRRPKRIIDLGDDK